MPDYMDHRAHPAWLFLCSYASVHTHHISRTGFSTEVMREVVHVKLWKGEKVQTYMQKIMPTDVSYNKGRAKLGLLWS